MAIDAPQPVPRVTFRQDRYIVFNQAATEMFLAQAKSVILGIDPARNLVGIKPVQGRHPKAVRLLAEPTRGEQWIPAFGFLQKHGLKRPTEPIEPCWDIEDPGWISVKLP